jgi:NtrC-family two-component system response regulator AlgB
VGGSPPIALDVRVVAATNRDLERDVATGRFRADLFYRIHVVPIELPPLRERREDVRLLAEHFLAEGRSAAGRGPRRISPEAAAALERYPWPGNVRELRNAIERALILARGQVLEPESFPERIAASASSTPVLGGAFTVDEIEREHVLRVMAHTATMEEAARVLGIDASTLWRKRKKWGR